MNDRTGAAQKTANLLQGLWTRNLPQLRERIAVLDLAAAEAMSGSLDVTTCAEAAAVAHKLAGSLGMFGYTQGTLLARDLDTLLSAHTMPIDPGRLRTLVDALKASLPL